MSIAEFLIDDWGIDFGAPIVDRRFEFSIVDRQSRSSIVTRQ